MGYAARPVGRLVGRIDFVHVGGPCAPATRQHLTNEVRAVVVGADFFARRTTGAAMCYLHGVVRNGEVKGWELCSGSNAASVAFAVRLTPPSDEQPDPRRR